MTHVRPCLVDLPQSWTSLAFVSPGRISQGEPTVSHPKTSNTADAHLSSVDVSQRPKLCLQLHIDAALTQPDDVARSTPVLPSVVGSHVDPGLTAADCDHGQFLSDSREQRQRAPHGCVING